MSFFEGLNEYYLGIKAFHVIAFVSWMAVLFYLPRLFVYHVEHADNKGFVDVVKIQERKLYYMIGYPSMVLTVLSGLLMILIHPYLLNPATNGAWLHLKLVFAFLLLVYHFACGCYLRKLAVDNITRSGKFFRVFNEAPTICLIVIAIAAVLKNNLI